MEANERFGLVFMEFSGEEIGERLAVDNYVRPGPLWWAFNWAEAKDKARHGHVGVFEEPEGWTPDDGCVVLIDEIDKAETDVPNGLLEALGVGQFTPFGRSEPVKVTGKVPPLVVITTNEERTLPDAFIRRCLVLFLGLPEGEEAMIDLLVQRGARHFPGANESVLKEAACQLVADRTEAKKQGWLPLPGQAEYLDLMQAVL